MYLPETVGPRRKARRVNLCYEIVKRPLNSIVSVQEIRDTIRKEMKLPKLTGEAKLGDYRATGDALGELGVERTERYGKMSFKITHKVFAIAHTALHKHENSKELAAA